MLWRRLHEKSREVAHQKQANGNGLTKVKGSRKERCGQRLLPPLSAQMQTEGHVSLIRNRYMNVHVRTHTCVDILYI